MSRFTCFLVAVLLSVVLSFSASADVIGGGRAIPPGWTVEVYGGIGEMNSLDGGVEERGQAGALSGGLSADVDDLNLGDDTSSWFLGGQVYNKWVTFLVDYRATQLDASGTAEREVRLGVDNVAFAGLELDNLLIPVGTEYEIDAETNWLGVAVRVTPFTVFPEGRVRFTPWLHLGVQVIDADYDVDAGAAVNLQSVGFPSRTFVERGRAEGDEQAGIPEYGIGGEARFLLGPEAGAELVGQVTYKLLDFQGALDTLGADKEEFEDIDLDYTAVEANLFLVYPLNDTADLLAGIYLEHVEADAVLDSKSSLGDFDRVIDASYTLWGVRAGFRF